MRHRKHHTRLSRPEGHRNALLRNLATALIEHERIRTTERKAKALRPYVEKLITLGKNGTVHHRRLAFAQVGKKHAVHKVFEDLAKRNMDRPGGYTRIIKDGPRMGDGAPMAIIEFVEARQHGEIVEAPEEATADA